MNKFKHPFPNWQLHRGLRKDSARENSMLSFTNAKKIGCEMVELDVRLSADDTPVVFHDSNLMRLFGDKAIVSQMRMSELRNFEIPSLQDVLISEDVPKSLNIEVKSEGIFCYRLCVAVAKVLRESSKDKKILLSSFNPLCLFWLSFFSAHQPRALIIDKGAKILSLYVKLCLIISRPHYLNVHYSLLDNKKTRLELMRCGLPIVVWTVNDYEKSREYLKGLAVGIISDLPPQI